MSAKAFKEVAIPVTEKRAFMLSTESIVIDKDKRTVELSFSSEEPVKRYWGVEILDHAPSSIDMSRLLARAPLLKDHDPGEQVGVVERAWLDGKRGKALVRFSRSEDGEEIFQDVVDGIRSSVSVGYEIRQLKLQEETDGLETYRVTEWCPAEISIVSIPADISVGVGRSNPKQETRMHKIFLNPTATDGGGTQVVPDPSVNTTSGARSQTLTITQDHAAEARKAEAQRTTEIFELAKQHGVEGSELREFMTSGRSAAEFQKHILATRYSKAKEVDLGKANIGMSERDVKRYSITRAINHLASGNTALDGLEGEMSVEARKRYGRECRGNFTIPTDVLHTANLNQRALSAGTATAGGYLVDDTLATGDFIELLRNRTVVNQLGARTLSGLTGNVTVPLQSGASTAYWIAEAASVTNSDITLGQKRLNPHGLAARGSWSKELVAQASMSVEMLVRDDIAKQLAIAKDLACLSGSGSSGQPIGILNTSGIGAAVTFGGAATWAKIVQFETEVAAANADGGTLAWAISPSTRGKWKSIVKVSSTDSRFLMDENGLVNGYRAVVSQQAATSTGLNHKCIFGDWSQLVVADWAGLDVTVDPYSDAATGQVRVIFIQWTDTMVRQATAFQVSVDAANQ